MRIARERLLQQPDRYVDHIFGEEEVGGTGWLYLSAVPFEKLGFPTHLGNTAYPEFTKDFLLAVPLVLMLWPSALAGIGAIIRRRERLIREEAKAREPGEEASR